MTKPRLRFLTPMLLISSCLMILSAVVAISLISQQEAITQALRENVNSHRAAIELKECINDLIVLEDDNVRRVTPLHERVKLLLTNLNQFADQEHEQRLYERTAAAFEIYLVKWSKLPLPTATNYEGERRKVTRYLESEVLKPCLEFEMYNTTRVAESTAQQERVLRQLAWGIVGVGLMGGFAGIVLGYGVARSVARSIQQLQFQIRDVAGKLGTDVATLVVTKDGDFSGLQAEIDRLRERIEQVVRDLKARELEVLRAEQLAAVGQLAAGVAHELRNPLTSIKLLIQAEHQRGGELSGEDLTILESEIRRMEKSLNAFLDFARPPKLQRKQVELRDLLDSVMALLRVRAEQQRVTLSIEMVSPVLLTVDPERFRQVLLNVGLNAVDAMPGGGQLNIRVLEHRSRLEIVFADTGAGIAENIKGRLFTPFASTKDTGLGLGLVISQRIVEEHGGTLTGENRLSGGAEFRILLPWEGA